MTAAMLTPTPSFAVIEDPPSAAFEITIFPQRDFVSAGWNGTDKALTFDLTRGGVNVGHAASNQVAPALTTDAAGILEVNHPGGLCWAGSTPDILPGDVLTITEGPDVGARLTTLNVTANAAVATATGIEVTGTALNLDGTPMDLSLVEQRIINPDGFSNGRRDIRATSDGGSLGSLVATGGGNWRATYALGNDDVDLALAGQTRALAWMATDVDGNRLGITIYEVGEVGGPGMGGCPAGAANSVTAAAPASVNAANIAGGLTLSGASFDASSVTITLDDANPATAPVMASGAPVSATGASAYTVTFTGAQLATLSDGMLTATSLFTQTGGTIAGTGTTVLKDTLVPLAPTTDTAPGTYASAQSIRLSRAASEDVASVVHYTTDGSAPTAASPTLQPIAITSSRTVRGVVVDPAGNVSPASAFAYTITSATPAPPAPPGSAAIAPLAPRIGLATPGALGGARTAMARWSAPKANGAVVTGYQVRALRLRPGRSAKVLPAVVAGQGARKMKLALSAGKYRFQVRATSAAGNSPWSTASNKVVAR
jgi:hypothetical protein